MAWDTDPRDLARRISSTGQDFSDQFQAELTRRAKLIAERIQNDIGQKSKDGVVPFTKKAIRFTTVKSKSSQYTYNNINIQPNQAKYLQWVLGNSSTERKIIPFSSAPLTKEGNITGLRARMKSGRYKVVQAKNGRKYVVDTKTAKRKGRIARVIGVLLARKRKQLFDFYKQSSRYAQQEINGMQGAFKIKWN